MTPGDLGFYSQSYIDAQVPRIYLAFHKWFRAEVSGMENLPDSAFLSIGNHSGGVLIPDTFIWLSAYHMLNRTPKMLALTHPAIFRHYPRRLAASLAKMGAIRADAKLALKALAHGYAVQLYPGGDLDACRPFYKGHQIEFAGQTSYIKLAKRAKVPIVPVVSSGAHKALCIVSDGARLAKFFRVDRVLGLKAFPIALCLPWGISIGPMPYLPFPVKVKIRVLPPIEVSGDIQAVDDYILSQMNQALSQMRVADRSKRVPHAE